MVFIGCGSHTTPEDPTDLSCSTYFDALVHCWSLRGWFNAYYRHGDSSHWKCTEEWANLTTCFKARYKMTSEGRDAAKDLLKQHREFLESQKKKPVPVWPLRTSPPSLFVDQPQQTTQDNQSS